MPEIVPSGVLYMLAETPALPAAVEAVCVPCPSSSRAESNSSGPAPINARYEASICLAPRSLLLHVNGTSSGLSATLPNWQFGRVSSSGRIGEGPYEPSSPPR